MSRFKLLRATNPILLEYIRTKANLVFGSGKPYSPRVYKKEGELPTDDTFLRLVSGTLSEAFPKASTKSAVSQAANVLDQR
jgi:hypothetical protein